MLDTSERRIALLFILPGYKPTSLHLIGSKT